MPGARILIVDDETNLREMLGILLKRSGYRVESYGSVVDATRHIAAESPYQVVITDLVMPDGSGMDVLEAARARSPETQVIMITAFAATDQAVDAMRKGAYDYIKKPFKNHELLATLEKAIEKQSIVAEVSALRAQVEERWSESDIIGKSPALESLRDLLKRVAPSPTSVLITGPSGSGKEMVARALHYQSPRANAPFIALNCGAVPETLIESELFGHAKGAFTGANSDKEGIFQAAQGGTLFLDEVGELPPSMQVSLLRALQERRVRPVGAQREIEVDVRVLAATNRDLEKDVASGKFRQDLFYRLNVIRIRVPGLCERREDIPLLAQYFVRKHAALQGKRLELAPEALRALMTHNFPGNVRELENMIERGVTLAPTDVVTREDLESGTALTGGNQFTLPDHFEAGFDLDAFVDGIERQLLRTALDQAGGVRKKAADLLGMTFRAFRYRLKKHAQALGLDEIDED